MYEGKGHADSSTGEKIEIRTIILLAAMGIALTLGAGAAFAQVTYNSVQCHGGNCQGTNRPDRIGGTEGCDRILAKAGEDSVHAGGDKDKVFGGRDADYMYGGEAKDELRGGDGKDFIFGGTGSDELFGDADNDHVISADDAESDRVYCGPGANVALVDPEGKVADDCEILESDGVVTTDGEAKARQKPRLR